MKLMLIPGAFSFCLERRNQLLSVNVEREALRLLACFYTSLV